MVKAAKEAFGTLHVIVSTRLRITRVEFKHEFAKFYFVVIFWCAKNYLARSFLQFNNAGYVHPEDGPIHMGGTVKAMDDLYKLYVRSPYLLVQEGLPELIKNKGTPVNKSTISRISPNNDKYIHLLLNNRSMICIFRSCNQLF